MSQTSCLSRTRGRYADSTDSDEHGETIAGFGSQCSVERHNTDQNGDSDYHILSTRRHPNFRIRTQSKTFKFD